MKLNRMGSSDLMVSPISIGCFSFGGNEESYWGEQSQKDVDELVAEALHFGVNFFDTALMYNNGESEKSLAHALKGRRHEAIICNKLLIQESALMVEEMINDSLKRLNTDYIDLMMIHWPVKDRNLIAENLIAFDKLREKGVIRHVGVSNFALGTLDIAKEINVPIVADEFVYNLISRGVEYEVLPYCIKNEIGLVAYMPIMQGILSGKYSCFEDIPKVRSRTIHFDHAKNDTSRHHGQGAEKEVWDVVSELKKVSAELHCEPGQIALSWLISKQGVTTAIVGCRNREQLMSNIKAGEIGLSKEQKARLDTISESVKSKLGNNLDLWESGEDSRIW